jgi:hypothetical protein
VPGLTNPVTGSLVPVLLIKIRVVDAPSVLAVTVTALPAMVAVPAGFGNVMPVPKHGAVETHCAEL